MRHRKSFNHLNRTSAHRKALLRNLSSSLIEHKRIFTTTAKAKALRSYIEPIMTVSKEIETARSAEGGTEQEQLTQKQTVMHLYRKIFRDLHNKKAVKTLVEEIAPRILDRPGGYTRIIKLSQQRRGDAAQMCMIELVDFNEVYTNPAKEKKEGEKKTEKKAKAPSGTRRSRSRKKKSSTANNS